MSGRSFEFYNNLGRFNYKITTQKSGRWNKPVIVITVVTAKQGRQKLLFFTLV
jgi:hypothetical protein